MALIGQPKIVILSNPLEGVDPQSKRKLIETIIKYTEGRALLLSTQSADVAERRQGQESTTLSEVDTQIL